MHPVRCLIVALFAGSLLPGVVVAGPVADDEWPRYGREPALTGRSPLHGDITSPHLSWTFSLAGRQLLLELLPEAGETSLAIPSSQPAIPQTPRVALPETPTRDVDGSGKLRPAAETFHERWAKLLPDVPGLQRVAWSHTWTTEKVCRLQLFAYDQGFDRPRQVWQTDPPEDTIFNPLNIVYDIDGDGVQEICTAAHYRVMIFEGTTGRKESELRYHAARPYGWFGLADLDGDSQMELVTIGDFQSHIDVLDFDRSKPESERLRVIWRRDIENDISQRTKWPQVGPRPLADVNGDGRAEIVLSLFNDTRDGQWHTVVLDAMTGNTLHDFPSRFTRGNADVDSDGACEIFLTESDSQFVVAAGQIELVSLKGSTPRVIWSRRDAGWVTADLPSLGATWSTTGSEGMKHVLLDGDARPAFAVWSAGSEARGVGLAVLRSDEQGQVRQLWEMNGLPVDVDAVAMGRVGGDAATGLLVRSRIAAGSSAKLSGRGVGARVVKNESLAAPVSSPIAARLKAGKGISVVAEGAGGQVVVIAPPDADHRVARIAWQHPGRGMTDGSRPTGPLAIDLDGDGGSEVVIADRTARGHAVLMACRGDGSELWRREFPQIPGGPAIWNIGALTYWWPGQFREPGKTDLFVSTRRQMMHSDIVHLLDGRSGEVVWTRTKAVIHQGLQWGYAGFPVSVADVNADGRDEIVNLYPVAFWIADGRDGTLIAAKDLSSRTELPAWAAYGEPMVRDFTGDGLPDVLLDSVYILALLNTLGSPIWHGPGRADYPTAPGAGNVDETTSVRHALIDFDGDGRFEIASAGYGDGVRAIDPADGKKLWSLKAPVPTCSRSCAADIDGHKGDEMLYVAGDTLIAVTGDRSGGRLLWEWKGPANLSMPAIADTDGDGRAEIVIQAADGSICCIDSPATR